MRRGRLVKSLDEKVFWKARVRTVKSLCHWHRLK